MQVVVFVPPPQARKVLERLREVGTMSHADPWRTMSHDTVVEYSTGSFLDGPMLLVIGGAALLLWLAFRQMRNVPTDTND